MNIVVYGIGGVGGFFGGKLAKAGNKITFIARGAHLEAIKKKGLTVKSIDGDFVARPTQVVDSVEGLEEVDLILLAVKSWQLAEVAQQILPIVSKKTLIIPLQNGADNVEKLVRILPQENIVGGLCRIISKVESPGVINHFAFHPQIIIGELNSQLSSRLIAVKKIFAEAGVDCQVSEDINAAIWTKFLFIATISGIGGLTRAVIGVMRDDAFIRNMMQQTAEEILAVAKAKQINIDHTTIEKAFLAIDKQAYNSTASMQRDIMEGKPSELEEFNGYIVKEGMRLGIETPINQFIYACLLPMEKKARKAI